MNKTAIKNFAIWARNKLIADIVYQAGLLGVTEKGIANALPQSSREVQFFDIGTKDYITVRGNAIRQRDAFVAAIKTKQADTDYVSAFRFIVEKVAYTWFNRLIAIRFMEVNDYLPSRVRVLSSENPGKAEPDMVTRPFDTDMSFSAQEQDEIMRMKDENKLDELFRMLFIKQCQKLSEVLPRLFDPQGIERVDSYLELLLTISFTDKDGVLWHLTHDISEDDFNIEKEGQVEIIGWMYQYYNTEQNELVYDGTLSKAKIPKELLPAATTIYTPDWAVKYMVHNSLGRLWTDMHPNFDISKWKYYLSEADQDSDVKNVTDALNQQSVEVEQLRCIDICMGSGHILVHLIDVLMDIYISQGWTEREAIQSIIRNNIYGLDIDDRAAQLAYFAVMMKARQYDRRFFERKIIPHVLGIQESNQVNRSQIDLFGTSLSSLERNNASNQLNALLDTFVDAKEYGSILEVPDFDFELLSRYLQDTNANGQIALESIGIEETQAMLSQLIEQARVFTQKYHVVITNPPYLGSSRFNPKLDSYIKTHEPEVKSDLSMVMYRHALRFFSKNNGYVSFITTTSWMFISSFEKMRLYLNDKVTLYSLVDFGTELFDGKVGHNPIVAWIVRNCSIPNYQMTAIRLVDYCYSRRDEKEPEFFNQRNRYVTPVNKFSRIPGSPVAYWVSERFAANYSSKKMADYAEIITGMTIGDNNKYLRLWFELDRGTIAIGYSSMDDIDISKTNWIPYSKGGQRRNWYGNYDYVVNWKEHANFNRSKTTLKRLYLKPALTWPFVTSGAFSARVLEKGFLWDVAGSPCFFSNTNTETYALAFLCSKVADYILKVVNPTINVQAVDIQQLPLIIDNADEIEKLSKQCIEISRMDWDSQETSWNFVRHPLLNVRTSVKEAYDCWDSECNRRFNIVKANEEQLNRLFIDIYGLSAEIESSVLDRNISIRRANYQQDIRSLISYAVGCMFGRYSLDLDGLIYAGGKWDASKYISYQPDPDNCIPITDEPYFEDDIVGRFVEFVKTAYGAETLEDNLTFIANGLGTKGNSSREIIRNYFLNDFYTDHCSNYSVTGSGKRPIYWQFDSGKQNGFKALVYMHRWNADTVGNLRVEYLHRMQRVYEKEIERMQDIIDNSRDNREVNQASKRREKLVKQLKEARDYDAKIAHAALSRVEVDLDDGVKVNYEKVQKGPDGKSLGILAKI